MGGVLASGSADSVRSSSADLSLRELLEQRSRTWADCAAKMKAPPGNFLRQSVLGKVDYVVADVYRTRAP